MSTFVHLDDHYTSMHDDQLAIVEQMNYEGRDYDCDYLACPIGKCNEDGCQDDDDDPCLSCPTKKFLGSSKCYPDGLLLRDTLPTISLAPKPMTQNQMS